ncbi:hypothetical protein RFI_00670 [Reticulomyxa filosa]|uniref:Uncharacterized protein n=1 Tax=Reticulomyxa filosa TaxID=46433 RepID=X6PFG1_RETFI|nr:hypothetical protein RFI_00670 [Reticulomyxa filosa]|eukprot:ETO36392.1 hypothetical protein RFI_00670 [Reticulomyxa filosa]
MTTLALPNTKQRQPPKKTGNPVLDLWFEAQYEIDCGKMPTLVKKNEASLKNMGRVRAPTTWETLQSTIDQHTSVQKEKNAEAGDYSDDEEDEMKSNAYITYKYIMFKTRNTRTVNCEEWRKGEEEKSGPRICKKKNCVKCKCVNQVSASPANGGEVRSISPEPVNRGDAIRRKWFKAQTQIAEGRNPSILKKHGNDYRIENLRKYNKRYKTASKGSDGFLKFEMNLTAPRKTIAADLDEDGEDDEITSVSRTGSTVSPNEASVEMGERGIEPIPSTTGKEDKNWDVNIDAVDSLTTNNERSTRGSDISPAPTPTRTTPNETAPKQSSSNPSSTRTPDSNKQTSTSTKRGFFGFSGFSKNTS